MNKLNINRLKEFNQALANISDEIKDEDLTIYEFPLEATPLHFWKLISAAADDLPELKEIFVEGMGAFTSYEYFQWQEAIATFLGFDEGGDYYSGYNELLKWAKENPKLWGCKRGCDMFSCEWAYDKTDPRMPPYPGKLNHRDLIAWWAQVEKNITKQEIKI